MVAHKSLLGSHAPNVLGSDGLPALKLPKGWNGFLIERKKIPVSAECGPQYSGVPTIMASMVASGRRWYRCFGKTIEMECTPGVDMVGSTYERDYARWEFEPGAETVCMRMPPFIVQRYLQDEAHRFDLETRYSVKDDSLAKILFTVADELQSGLPNGLLYAEGLCITALGWLNRHYVKQRCSPLTSRNLSTAKQARLREFIDAQLGQDLSIERMAAEVGISPNYFAQLFRLTFGTSPHRYVLQRRIERAAQILRDDRQRSVTEIAMSLGFSSPTHFSTVFKIHRGLAPSEWRRS